MQNHKDVKFSITIPAFKTRFLGEAIDSCLGQSYDNYEIIIVDDASPEDIKAIVSAYDDTRIQYYRNKKNCGALNVVDNWNICLGYCTGDYVICIGDDDKLKPNCLELYLQLMESYPNLDVYHAQTEIIDENSVPFEIQAPRPLWESAYSVLWNRWASRGRQFIGDFCYKVDSLRRVGGYIKLPLAWASDDIMAVWMAKDKGIANTQTPCFQYRESKYTISRSSNSIYKLDAIKIEKEWFQNFLTSQPLNDTDMLYYRMACEVFEEHFRYKYDCYLFQALMESSWNIKWCISHRAKYEMSFLHILHIAIRAFKENIKRILR